MKLKARQLAANGYSQRQIAKELGIHRRLLSKWKYPKTTPWKEEALKLLAQRYTRKEIAEKVGKSLPTIKKFLKGKSRGVS